MRQENERNAARFEKNANLRNKMRQIWSKNAAVIIPMYQQLGNTNTLILDTLALH